PGDLSEDFVEDTVNAKIEYRPEFYTSDNSGIVVFTKRGVVQRAVGFRPYPFDGNRAVYGPNVAVKPSPTHHLRFIDELA
ncbi:MAG: hypothetical protein ACRDTE_23755, partial [Pseudonocardiaceae bacterium]